MQGVRERPRAGRDTYAAAGVGRADTPKMASAQIGEGNRAAELTPTIQIAAKGSHDAGLADARFVAEALAGPTSATSRKRSSE
ncbi:MAG: hypothetical protein WAL63_03675 [Solirubrobacteraceae bacterium]